MALFQYHTIQTTTMFSNNMMLAQLLQDMQVREMHTLASLNEESSLAVYHRQSSKVLKGVQEENALAWNAAMIEPNDFHSF